MALFKHILVPTDFGDPSQQALEIALELGRTLGAELTIMHTCEIPVYAYPGMAVAPMDLLSPIEDAAGKKLDDLVSTLSQRCRSCKGVLKVGIPWQEILEVVNETQADLVVMGTHGRRGVTHALLGSVAERIVRMSPVPVLTVRAR
jgi:nucleotide-binding universal stress UspA family protein